MTLIETIIVVGGVIGALLTSLCFSIRRSRCETIDSPCISCSRKLMTADEMKADVMNKE
jgi:hypothetical protein